MHVHDPIHGQIALPRLCAQIAQTREFRRLQHIRQLGGCSFVYPSATHTRYQHSLGVCHLAGKVATTLQKRYPSISDDDVLCLQLAGLVHDLGHGPFSHLFEKIVPGFRHEVMGVSILHAILQKHLHIDVRQHFASDAISNVNFVGLMVTGLRSDQPWPSNVGRTEDKRFLLEIVNAKNTGMDVDRFDYLMRDCAFALGATNVLCIDRIIECMRVVDGNMCFAHRGAEEVMQVFQLRARLHRQVYQHRASLLTDHVLTSRIERDHLETLRSSARDVHAFVELVDNSILTSLKGKMNDHGINEYRRAPTAIILPTRPLCVQCKSETDVQDSYCANCGWTTEHRAKVLINGAYETIASQVTETEATDAVNAALGTSDLVVCISDVNCGNEVIVKDTWGNAWRQFETVASVPFVAADGTPIQLSPQALFEPEIKRMRVAVCYAHGEISNDRAKRVDHVFRKVMTEKDAWTSLPASHADHDVANSLT